MSNNTTDILAAVCASLSDGNRNAAKEKLANEYRFESIQRETRTYTPQDSLRVFIQDGFIDRYSGARLIFPGTLRVLSHLMPSEFPYHRNWKRDHTHTAYWDLSPTVDHLVPISRGGVDASSNMVTTSMLHNAAKSDWSLEELGWTLHPAGDSEVWDGLLKWFMNYVGEQQDLQAVGPIRDWHKAAVAILG